MHFYFYGIHFSTVFRVLQLYPRTCLVMYKNCFIGNFDNIQSQRYIGNLDMKNEMIQ